MGVVFFVVFGVGLAGVFLLVCRVLVVVGRGSGSLAVGVVGAVSGVCIGSWRLC